MARFTGKRILITGGTSGMGLAAARRIVAEGGEVAVTGTTQEHLDEAGRTLPPESLVLRNDASDPDAAIALADKIRDMDGIDGLWLNAGYGKFWDSRETDADRFDAMNNVNVRGPALQMAKLIPLLKDAASVVVTASVAAYLGQDQGAVYAGTKAALTGMARAWAAELAPRGIRVNAVAPGPIETGFFDDLGLSEDKAEAFTSQIKKQVPLGRIGTAEEAAAVALFLLSDDASYVTGSEYMVDGGMTMR